MVHQCFLRLNSQPVSPLSDSPQDLYSSVHFPPHRSLDRFPKLLYYNGGSESAQHANLFWFPTLVHQCFLRLNSRPVSPLAGRPLDLYSSVLFLPRRDLFPKLMYYNGESESAQRAIFFAQFRKGKPGLFCGTMGEINNNYICCVYVGQDSEVGSTVLFVYMLSLQVCCFAACVQVL